MKFTTDTHDLKKALKTLGLAVISKPILPILGHIQVAITKGAVFLTTTDTGITITYRIKCETEGKGILLLPYAELKSLMALEAGNVTITTTHNGPNIGKIMVLCEADEFCLGKPADVTDFPKLPVMHEDTKVEVAPGFITSMAMAALSCSTDSQKPQMQCILLELMPDNQVNTVSTDTHTLYLHNLHPATGNARGGEPVELLIPARVADVLKDMGDVTVSYNGKHAAFISENITVCTTLGELKYPAYRKVMPTLHNANITVNQPDLAQALDKALVLCSDTVFNIIQFHFNSVDVELKTADAETGMSGRCIVPATVKDNVTDEIRLNGRLFAKALKQIGAHLTGADQISLSIQGPGRPVTIQIAGKNNVTILAVPVTGGRN